jgi:integrase
MKNLPKYTHHYRDRHARWRTYGRRPGRPQVALPDPASAEFWPAYAAFMADQPAPPAASERKATQRGGAGTVGAAVTSYLRSTAFSALAERTRSSRGGYLEHFRRDHGAKRLAKLEKRHIAEMMAGRTAASARMFLGSLRAVMQHAVELGMIAEDPTATIKRPAVKSDGHHTWTEDEIGQFEVAHPVGTKQRLALALLLFTAQRRSDVILLGRQHVRDGVINLTQQKTGAKLAIPMHPELAAIIEATPSNALAYLVTERGTPYSTDHFGDFFRAACDKAGLPKHCSAHGLRKAACRRLAEAGASTHEIAAISGHKTLGEIERYTKAADQAKLAKAAMARTSTARR